MAVPVYRGKFGQAQATRLLWRAGFGPRPGDARRYAKLGLAKSVSQLLNPPRERLTGPAPVDDDGLGIAPNDLWGHDLLWFLDKMVRSNRPLVERMALVWHDWFATGDVGSNRFSIDQAQLFRRRGLGSFAALVDAVTQDKAMLVWLSGIYNHRWAPNENYARELMELFTLGASDETGYPYSEDDVREMARTLTGWAADWRDDVGLVNFRFRSDLHDQGQKTVFGRSGSWDWQDAGRICVEHEAHARYFVERLWSYFIPVAPPAPTRRALERIYVERDHAVRPLLAAILKHPLLYQGPAMVKPPVVMLAGMLRARRRGIDTEAWSWTTDMAGQRLFRPPNVAGWDEDRWLDTASFRGRWTMAARVVYGHQVDTDDDDYPAGETPAEAVDRALTWWANPPISEATRAGLIRYCRAVEGAIVADWQEGTFRALRQNALRMLIATSPDLQTC